jgi:hemolysin III
MLAGMHSAKPLPLPYTAAEERWHSGTHLLGLIATAASIPWLLWRAAGVESGWRLAGAITFSVAALLMFAASVVYHRSSQPEARQRWRLVDHSMIFLLIAGTYTPFAALLAAVWAIALGGIAAKLVLRFRYPRLSTALYLLLGWVGVAAIKPLWNALDTDTLAWIAAGGLCYTLGVPFYVWKSRRYTHALWHLFVLAGVACHFVAVMTVL